MTIGANRIHKDVHILTLILKSNSPKGSVNSVEQMEVKEYLKTLLKRVEDKKENTVEKFQFNQMKKNVRSQIDALNRYDELPLRIKNK